MENSTRRRGRIAAAVVLATVACAVVGAIILTQTAVDGAAVPPAPARSPGPSPVQSPTRRTPPAESPDVPSRSFDRSAHSTTDPASIWVIVNKTRPITPLEFRPEISLVRGYQVATPAARPLERLLADSDRRGLGFKIASAFRSYDYQVGIHANVVATRGQVAADRVSARAGYSEHQTGLAVDLVTPGNPGCDFEACFADTAGGRWLAREAWRYGLVVRY